jgi:hypothetical protein
MLHLFEERFIMDELALLIFQFLVQSLYFCGKMLDVLFDLLLFLF